MQLIHFEAADSRERTQIGEGLTRPVVQVGRLETGREEGRYFLDHADGCTTGDEGSHPIEEGDSFYLDADTGAIYCEEHGRTLREDHDRSQGDSEPENGEVS